MTTTEQRLAYYNAQDNGLTYATGFIDREARA